MSNFRTPRNLWAAIFALLALLLSTAAQGAGLSVQVTRIAHISVSPVLAAMGEVRSLGSVTITAPATGRLQGPFPPAGEIQRGTPIARIVPAGLAAQLSAARAQAAYAAESYHRDQKLFHYGVIPKTTVDSGRVLLAQNRATLHVLQAESGQLTLKSPFSGTISYRVSPGAVVSAGTVIASLQGRGRPWVQAMIPPQKASAIVVGSAVSIQSDGWRGPGKVQSIGQSARQSGLIPVIIHLPSTSTLLPGEWVSLQFQLQNNTAHLFQVPQSAVVMQGNQAIVWGIQKHQAERIPVQIVYRSGHVAVIRGSIRTGEPVITEGNTLVRSGTVVNIHP